MLICEESMQTHTITSIPEPENGFLKQTALYSLEKTPFHLHSNFLDVFLREALFTSVGWSKLDVPYVRNGL